MHEIVNSLQTVFAPLAQIHPLIYVLVIAMVPVIELRGAIPVGIALGLPWWQVLLVAIVGNIIPAPFIVLLFKKFMDLLRQKQWLPWLTKFLDKRFSGKTLGERVFWGIVVFTAIPLPGTGAWTASGLASILELPVRRAVLAVFLGCVIAGIVVTAISLLGKTYGVYMVVGLVVAVVLYLVISKIIKDKKVSQAQQPEDS